MVRMEGIGDWGLGTGKSEELGLFAGGKGESPLSLAPCSPAPSAPSAPSAPPLLLLPTSY